MWGIIKNELIKYRKGKKIYIVGIAFIAICLMSTYSYYINDKDINNEILGTQETISMYKTRIQELQKRNKNANLSKKETEINKRMIEGLTSSLSQIEENLKNATNGQWTKTVTKKIDMLNKQMEELNKKDISKLSGDKQVNIINQKYNIEKQIKANQFLIDNNINPLIDSDIDIDEEFQGMPEFNAINNFNGMESNIVPIFIPIIIIIICADVVSGEYAPPTMKMLLTKPVPRWKVILSKFIASVIISTLIIVGIQFFIFLCIGIFKGFGNFHKPIFVGTKYEFIKCFDMTTNEPTTAVPILGSGYVITEFNYCLRVLLFQFLFILATVSFGLLLSVILGGGMESETLGILSIIGLIVIEGLGKLKKITPFIFTTYRNPNIASDSMGSNIITFKNGIIILLLWAVVCYILSSSIFHRKDILV